MEQQVLCFSPFSVNNCLDRFVSHSPIEEAFSKIKMFLKYASAQTLDTLLDAIAAALETISVSDALGFFHHAGFTLPAQSS